MKVESFSHRDDKSMRAMFYSPFRPIALDGERRLHVLGLEMRPLESLMFHLTKET
jgi:hypothetical protein